MRPRGLVSRMPLLRRAVAANADDRALSRRLLLDSDLVTPSTQEVYSSLAAVAAACGRTPTEWYLGNLSDGNWTGVGGTVLTKGAGTIRFGRLWPGWNGTDMTSLRAVEFGGAGVTDTFTAGNNSTYDLTQSLVFVFQCRAPRAPTATRSIFGKDTSTASTTAGYYCDLTTGGTPQVVVCDGTSNATINGPGTTTAMDALTNGASQWFAVQLNVTTGFGTIHAYRTSGTPVALPAGSKSSATPFRIGGIPFRFSHAGFQILQWGVFTGAEAEAFTATDLDELDDWCRVPTQLTGHVRYHVIAPVVGTNASGLVVQHCAGSAVTPSHLHFAHAYKSNATLSSQKLGVLCERGVQDSSDTAATNMQKRNRCLHSDDFGNAAWTKTNITATSNAGDDPAGFYAAASLTATADNGTVTQSVTGEASEVHTVSVYVRRNGGSNVTGRLSINNSSGGAELGGAAFTATSTWTRVVVEVDNAAIGAVTALQFRLRLDTNGTSIFATYAQLEYGCVSEYMPQIAALKDKDNTEFYFDNSGGSIYDPRGGRIECTVIGHAAQVPSTGAFVFTTDCGASFEDRHFCHRDALTSTDEREVRIYDSAGVAVSHLEDIADATHTDEVTYVSEWEQRGALPGGSVRARAEVDGAVCTTGTTTATAAWQGGTNADRVFVGMRHTMTAHLEGVVERIRIYGPAENADALG